MKIINYAKDQMIRAHGVADFSVISSDFFSNFLLISSFVIILLATKSCYIVKVYISKGKLCIILILTSRFAILITAQTNSILNPKITKILNLSLIYKEWRR